MVKIRAPYIAEIVTTEEQIEQAKREAIKEKRREWAIKNRKYKTIQGPYGLCREVPDIDAAPPIESFNINWMVFRWPTGFAVIDTEAFEKLPKKVQNKLLKLGGLI